MTVPHQALDAEENVLGAMLLAPSAIDAVIGHVDGDDFYRISHGVMFKTMVDMHTKGEPVDAVTLAAELEKMNVLGEAGGKAKVAELAALVPATSNAAHYARIVKEKAVRRGLHRAGQLITQLAEQPNGETDEVIAQAETFLSDAILRNTTMTTGSITDGFEELVEEWRTAYKTGEPITGLLSGVGKLDELLHGFWPGQLVLAAARPSVGKSVLAQNCAENIVDAGGRVLFVTLEMSKAELQTRSVSRAAKIDGEMLAAGLIPESKLNDLSTAIQKVRDRGPRFFVQDTGLATIPGLTAEATRLHRQGGLDLIVVDYIQLMQGVGNTKAEEVGYISRGLKLLARRLNVPILALSQMSRAIISRTDKRPNLADLRESGALEQDADVVIFLHRDSDYDKEKVDEGEVELIVEKNRRGKTGSESTLFVKKYSSFLNPRAVESA